MQTTVKIKVEEFDTMMSDFKNLKTKLEKLDHLFAVQSYEKSKGTLKGYTANELLNDL